MPGSNFINGQNNLSSASNEMFNKMNNDPLMVMRAEEQKALQRLMANPLKMKAIRGAVDEQRQALEADRKREKKAKKEHKAKKEKKGSGHKERKHEKRSKRE